MRRLVFFYFFIFTSYYIAYCSTSYHNIKRRGIIIRKVVLDLFLYIKEMLVFMQPYIKNYSRKGAGSADRDQFQAIAGMDVPI